MPADEAKLKAALKQLSAVIAEVVATAEARSQMRCPYKTAELLCTFRGSCLSQRPTHGILRCAGDEFLLKAPR